MGAATQGAPHSIGLGRGQRSTMPPAPYQRDFYICVPPAPRGPQAASPAERDTLTLTYPGAYDYRGPFAYDEACLLAQAIADLRGVQVAVHGTFRAVAGDPPESDGSLTLNHHVGPRSA